MDYGATGAHGSTAGMPAGSVASPGSVLRGLRNGPAASFLFASANTYHKLSFESRSI